MKSRSTELTTKWPRQTYDRNYLFAVYSHADATIVDKRIKHLEQIGLPIQYDHGVLLGKTWFDELACRIAQSQGIVFFVSERSANSF